jgi:branched-chain amino acid transport system ATP-binding protein
MAATDAIMELAGLEVGYGGPAIVRGVSLTIRRGKMITFVGPNGAGKSTLLRAIHGSANVYAGTIAYDGHAGVQRSGPLERYAMGLAFVPQGRCNFPLMTVWENLAIAAHALSAAERPTAAERVLDMFPALRPRQATLAGNLSGGEQQMLEMAMVLQNRPKCLLVDEPSLGLSPAMQVDIFAKLAALRDTGLTVIAVEQNVRAAFAVSDDAAVLVQGEIVMHGRAEDINNDERMRKAYLGG